MDPEANMNEQLELAQSILREFDNDKVSEYDAARLAELVIALNDWKKNGGFTK